MNAAATTAGAASRLPALLGSGLICLLAAAVSTAADIGANIADDPPSEFTDAGIDALQAAFASGSQSVEALTRGHLHRIETLDRTGPELNSLISVNDRALEIAAALDAERAASGLRGPLHGIAVIVRDNLDTLDLPATAGSATLRGHEPLADAFAVGRLRAAGAVILAKSNLSDLTLALGRSGYSSAAGQTRNAYNLRRTPASAGDGAALAAGLGLLALGTDLVGELRGPAAVSALVALRPTPGVVGRTGLLPTALGIEVVGPMARSVHDLATMLNAIAAVDPDDPSTAAVGERPADYRDGLDTASLEGARIGIVKALRGGNREVDRAVQAAQQLLRVQGARLIPVTLPDAVLDGRERILDRLIQTERRDQVNAYLLNTEQGMPHSLAELLRMSESPLIAGLATPVNPAALGGFRSALQSPGLADLDYLEILSRRLPELRAAIAAIFAEHELDAIALPTMLCPASSLLYDYDSSYDCNAEDPYQPAYLASIAGLPELTLPMAWTEQGLPLGLSFVGRPFQETRLLALGHAFERTAAVRRPPELPDRPPQVLERIPETPLPLPQ